MLVGLLGVATGAGMFFQGALAVLASQVRAEFDLSRSQLGVVFTVYALVGGTMSPIAGRLADRSIRGVMVGLFVCATATVLMAAAAPVFAWLIAASLVGGLALGASNPVTNKAVSAYVSLRRRGLAIGLKQAGPPLGVVAAGMLLPPLQALVGWRWALASTAAIPIIGMAVAFPVFGREGRTRAAAAPGRLQPSAAAERSGGFTVGYLATLGAMIAFAGSALIAFLPLYSEESVGLSVSAAGLLVAIMGLVGMLARIAWGAIADRFGDSAMSMVAMSGLAAVATICIGLGTSVVALLWVGAFLSGLTMMAWHAVAWIALVNSIDSLSVGKASGLVQMGNGAGFATGPPVVGFLIDRSGYGPGWSLVAVVFVATSLLGFLWHRAMTRNADPAAPL